MANSSGTGIIIGRFQVFELNDIQKTLIDSVREKHQRVCVFLGINPAPSDQNPLEWPLRSEMFLEEYGNAVEVYEMPDVPDDHLQAQELDRRIIEDPGCRTRAHLRHPRRLCGPLQWQLPTEIMEAPPDSFPEPLHIDGIKHMSSFRLASFTPLCAVTQPCILLSILLC